LDLGSQQMSQQAQQQQQMHVQQLSPPQLLPAQQQQQGLSPLQLMVEQVLQGQQQVQALAAAGLLAAGNSSLSGPGNSLLSPQQLEPVRQDAGCALPVAPAFPAAPLFLPPPAPDMPTAGVLGVAAKQQWAGGSITGGAGRDHALPPERAFVGQPQGKGQEQVVAGLGSSSAEASACASGVAEAASQVEGEELLHEQIKGLAGGGNIWLGVCSWKGAEI
jgi:hypothetical protein